MARKPIFQEVAADAPRVAPVVGGLIDTAPRGARRAIRLWAWVILVLVTAMFLLGGAARLVSLDMPVERRDLSVGLMPPATEDAWAAEAAKYAADPGPEAAPETAPVPAAPSTVPPSSAPPSSATPDAQAIPPAPPFAGDQPTLGGPAAAPDVAAFKRLYLLEWAHRGVGILTFAIWALGLAAFAVRGRLPAGWGGRLGAIGVLLAAQGALGMVKTSAAWGGPVKVAAHVGMGFALVGMLTGMILLLGRSEAELIRARRAGEPRLFGMTTGLLHLTAVQAVVGAVVAAIGAGRLYTGWPRMGGEWIPADLWDAALGVQNLVLNPAFVQFLHRGLGYLVVIFAVVVWLRARRSPHPVTRSAFTVMLVAVVFLAALGITLVVRASPIPEALSHQFMAIAGFALIARARHNARMPRETTIRGTIR